MNVKSECFVDSVEGLAIFSWLMITRLREYQILDFDRMLANRRCSREELYATLPTYPLYLVYVPLPGSCNQLELGKVFLRHSCKNRSMQPFLLLFDEGSQAAHSMSGYIQRMDTSVAAEHFRPLLEDYYRRSLSAKALFDL